MRFLTVASDDEQPSASVPQMRSFQRAADMKQIGLDLYHAGDYGGAVEALTAALGENSNDAEARHVKALALMRLERFVDAIASLDLVLEHVQLPLTLVCKVRIRFALVVQAIQAQCLLSLAEPMDALDCLTEAIHLIELLKGDNSQTNQVKADLAIPVEMETPLSDLIAASHNVEAVAHLYAGYANAELAEHAAARLHFNRTAELEPSLAAYACTKIAQIELAVGDPEAALLVLDDALHLGESAELLAQRGFALLQLERFDDALQTLLRAVELEPENPAIALHRGCALLKLRRFAESLEVLTPPISSLKRADGDGGGDGDGHSPRIAHLSVSRERLLAALLHNRALVLVELGRLEEGDLISFNSLSL